MAIKVYYLEVQRLDNTDHIVGEQYIHDAICDVEGSLRKVIQDVTLAEDTALSGLAIRYRDPTTEELARLAAMPALYQPGAPLSFATHTTGLPDRIERIEEFLKLAFP